MSTSDLDKYLDNLPGKLRDELSAVVRDEAETLAEAQRAALRAQLQEPDETGALEASVQVISGAHDLEFVIQAGGNATADGGYDRAMAFEFGTSRQPARPFFYSTARERQPGIRDRIANAVERIMK
jgi:HK97 gp10 family phage protein